MKKKILFTAFLLSLPGTIAFAQTPVHITQDSTLAKEIVRTGIVHSPLPLDHSRSFEYKESKKAVLYRQPVSSQAGIGEWKSSGEAILSYTRAKGIDNNCSLKLSFPTFTGKRAQGSPSDPDYATYGTCRIKLEIPQENWEKFNRIAFQIYPDCEGARVVNINFNFRNDESSRKPGIGSASHLINLQNRQWNYCFLDIEDFQRDQVKEISFHVSIKGKDRTTGDSVIYYISPIELQQIENPEIVSGWQPGTDRIVYSTSGYQPDGNKTAIVNIDTKKHGNRFRLLHANNQTTAFEGELRKEKTTIGSFEVADFSSFSQSGIYQLAIGKIMTSPFVIDSKLWENSLWRTLNFIFCQRCGYAVPGKHGTCHIDLCSQHNGQSISYGGGWHDAGDLSQQTLQTGDVTFSLLEAYNKLKDKNEMLAMRLLEEAEWGLEFILRNRYGDGYRASSVGLLIWQDGIFGTLDDISSVRVQNCAFDNFLYAAYEAYAALSINRDPMLQEHLIRVAKEDFEFAMKRHEEVGFGEFYHFYEHSYNTSESQYMATISWAASMLYKATGETQYAEIAAEYIRYTLACQRTESLKDKNDTKGFFYRDLSRQSLVHYNHQSREQVYMQAMILLCETQPDHPEYNEWEKSIRLYGNYLKGIMKYTAPYGMIPSGVYHIDEVKDDVSFDHQHLFQPPTAREDYVHQVRSGEQLDKEHYLRRFPVWFSIFNGNTAVHLSTGKSAALCGKFLNDPELLMIGREQLYWTVGKNPFGQSLIYGEGDNYPSQDSFSSGEITGEMPVGIRSLGNEDVPYWPQINNATYKEVWVTSAGKWISLAIEY